MTWTKKIINEIQELDVTAYTDLTWMVTVHIGLGLLGSSLLGEWIYPTGYCPIDRGSKVPTV